MSAAISGTALAPPRISLCSSGLRSRAHSLQRRMRRRQHDGRVHFLEESRTPAEKLLPGWILHRVAAGFGARVEARIGPDVAGLVRLPRFGRPEAHDLRI